MGFKDQILAAEDLPRRELHIPEWGVTVFVRTMSGRERDRFEGQQSRDPYADPRARLAVTCLCDGDGKAIFSDADVPALSAKSAKALDRVWAVASRLNGITREDLEELKKG